MSIPTVDGWDATHANLPQAPKTGQAAGYITGSPDIQWTRQDAENHPGFVQIDQSPIITSADVTADFYDLENGAVTLAEIAQLVEEGQAAFTKARRPGQRRPGVYCSRDNVTSVVNALLAGGVISCPLGVADYNFDHAQAQSEVANSSGPFPVVWRQYSDQGGGGAYDLDVFSVPWLQNISTVLPPKTRKVPEMLILKVTAPAENTTWTGTRTFLYAPGSVPQHIVSSADQAAFSSVLQQVTITWAQYVGLGGQ